MLVAFWTNLYLFVTAAPVGLGLGLGLALAQVYGSRWARGLPFLWLALPPWVIGYLLDSLDLGLSPWTLASLSFGLSCVPYTYLIFSQVLAGLPLTLELRVGVAVSPWSWFWLALRPLLAQALVPCLLLVLAETLSDLATVAYFGLPSLSLLCYQLWTMTYEIPWLGCLVLLGLALSLTYGSHYRPPVMRSSGPATSPRSWATLVLLLSLLPVLGCLALCFNLSLKLTLVPIPTVQELGNSLGLAVGVSVLSLLCGLSVNLGLGLYAMPGVVWALLLLLCNQWLAWPWFYLLLGGLVLRFSSVASQALLSSHRQQVLPLELLIMLSYWQRLVFRWVVQRWALLSTGLFICLEVLREIPVTLLLQPLDWQSLGLRLHYLAATENIELVAGYSLSLITLNLVLVLLWLWATRYGADHD